MNKLITGVFFTIVGASEEFGDVILWDYSRQTRDEVKDAVMNKAMAEGWRGVDVNIRLSELNWRIVEFSATEIPF